MRLIRWLLCMWGGGHWWADEVWILRGYPGQRTWERCIHCGQRRPRDW